MIINPIIKSGQNTKDATVKPIDISQGKIAYGKNGKLIGTSPFINNELAYIDGDSISDYDLCFTSNENVSVIYGH